MNKLSISITCNVILFFMLILTCNVFYSDHTFLSKERKYLCSSYERISKELEKLKWETRYYDKR